MEGADDVFAITCPLITKADGGKFGKTESGNVWLDPRYTSPYKFYQFWLNVSDVDAERYIKIFTELDRDEIERLIEEQKSAPGERPLQKRLAKEITTMVHSTEAYQAAVEASQLLFGGNSTEILHSIDEKTLLEVLDGVPTYNVASAKLESGMSLADLLVTETSIFPSKSELRKLAQQGGLSVNKEKVSDITSTVTSTQLLNGKYLLFQRGKKTYYLIVAAD